MTDPLDPDRMRDLEERIAKMKGEESSHSSKGDDHFSMANTAWRMVVELVAGLGIGLGMGWGLDQLFGTAPIFLIVFVILGFVAGIKTVMRTAQDLQQDEADAAQDAQQPVREGGPEDE